MNRRDLFKFLFGVGLGVAAAETYERLYNIPALERAFRKEIEYWLTQYLDAKRKAEELSSKLKTSEEEIDALQKDVSYWKSQYNSMQNEVNKLNTKVGELSSKLDEANEKINSLEKELDDLKSKYESTKEEANRLKSIIGSMDELERESVDAISYYREKMNEAIMNLKRTIEKYRAILGDDRVAFESSTVKILEDLKLTQEKLQKVLPYFPLILNFAWKPIKAINGKIYDINVSFEVISPLNSLREVEVMIIPEEYRYFITKYGMREEDYYKVFPKEEVRSVKIEPRNLEREMFSVDFEDLKGGREYIVKARVEDVAGREKVVEMKTPYIRQFENIAKTDDIIVIADYYTWYRQITEPGSHWRDDEGKIAHLQYPLLGEYASNDPVLISKHIDWATGHGIDAFSISWWTTGKDERTWDYHSKESLDALLRNPLIKDIKFCILYEDYGRLPVKKVIYDYDPNGNEFIPIDDPKNEQRLLEDFNFLANTYFSHPQYLKVDRKPVVQFDADRIWIGNIEEVIGLLRAKIKEKGYGMYLISNVLGWYFPNAPYDVLEERNIQIVKSMDAISAHGNMWLYGYEDARNDFPTFVKNLYEKWYNFARNYNSQIVLIPNLMPGEEIHPSWVRDPAYIPLKRSPQLFEALLRIALEYTDTKTKIIKISAFNEWGSGLQIEPSQEEGFVYLQLLKKYLKSR
jgi:outer membrane murein-binding lipoprotein Lpp